jgi:hypothetical protein
MNVVIKVPVEYNEAVTNAIKWKNINFVNKLIKEGKVKLVDQEGNKIKNTKLIWNQ